MCGRYTLTRELADWREYTGYSVPETPFKPRYNIGPGQFAPVVIDEEGQRVVKLMRWGLVPFWAKDESIAYKTINARSESVMERASFKYAMKKRRCLVLADGFYEWQKLKDGKQPHYFYLKNNDAFSIAGLWEKWDKCEDDEPLYTFTIVTTSPNELLETVHNRMPVILSRQDEATWLDHSVSPDQLDGLYAPYDTRLMASHPVGKAVGNVRNQGAELIEEAAGAGADD